MVCFDAVHRFKTDWVHLKQCQNFYAKSETCNNNCVGTTFLQRSGGMQGLSPDQEHCVFEQHILLSVPLPTQVYWLIIIQGGVGIILFHATETGDKHLP